MGSIESLLLYDGFTITTSRHSLSSISIRILQMDALTGKRRHGHPSSSSPSSIRAVADPTQSKEFVPELYKAQKRRRIRTEAPETEEERELIRSLPCDTEGALLHLKRSFPTHLFEGRLPPVFLYHQLSSVISSQFMIDSQLAKLAKEGKILTFSTFSSDNYFIVFLADFLGLRREGIYERFVKDVVARLGDEKEADQDGTQRSSQNATYFSKESLMKRWKFKEDEIRKLVNGGYLGIQEGGMYCMSLPGAGEFMKVYQKGRKAVMNAIKKAKFGEILQRELEQRPMKKSAPLGVLYHVYDLIGLSEVEKVDTTSGPLLRVNRKN